MNHQQELQDSGFRNWVRAGLGLKYVKEGLEPFIDNTANTLHASILTGIPSTSVQCNVCTLQNLLPHAKAACPRTDQYKKNCPCNNPRGRRICPNGVCGAIYDGIVDSHRFKGPSWKNTKINQWKTNHWQIAKCFMSPSADMAAISTAAETDCTGLLSVAINSTFFENFLTTNINPPNDNFSKARSMRNDIMHSPSQTLSDADLNNHIATMMDVLNAIPTPHTGFQAAQVAVEKLKQLQNENFIITDEDVDKLRREALAAIKEGVEAIQGEAEKATTTVKEMVETIQGKAEKVTKEGVEAIQGEAEKATTTVKEMVEAIQGKAEKVTKEGVEAIQGEAEKVTKEGVKAIQGETVKGLEAINIAVKSQAEQNADSLIRDYNSNKQQLQTDLITLYRKQSLSTPISSTKKQTINTSIEDIYVQPNMHVVDLAKTNSAGTKTNDKIPKAVSTNKDIFIKESKRCSSIYVSGDAGVGKSSFCQKMISAWCDAHSQPQNANFSTGVEVETLKIFDFLFYIPLRNVKSEYHVDEMIKTHLLKTDSQREVLPRILEKESERCLIILDGLDEWRPPPTYVVLDGVTDGLPHRNNMYKYTILTTSRPWKLEVLRLATSEIDQQINVSGFDDKAASEFIKKIVHHLNARNESSKSASDFEKKIKSNKLSQLKTIPVMLKQLILLWYSGKPLGKSQCDIYSGMIDLLLTQAEMRDKTLFENVCRKSDLQLPECFSDKSKCKECMPLLYSLAKLAFETLISKNRETSLVFEQSVAESHGVDENDIQTCLKVGIMSQDIVPDLLTDKTSVSFLHKSYQEYLAALYITMRAGEDKIIEHIFSVCNTVQMLLEMSKVVLFVCGMNPVIAEKLSPGIRNVTGNDSRIQQYRREVGEENEYIRNIHNMIIDCMNESSANGHGHPNLPLDDIYIERYSNYSDRYPALQHQVTQNTANIKSVYCKSKVRYPDLLQHIVHCESLEKIDLEGYLTNMSLDNFTSMLNLPKIVALGLHKCELTHDQESILMTSLSQKTVLRKLVALRLSGNDDSCILLTHDQMCTLMTSLSQRTQLTQIVLWKVGCSDHGYQCRCQLDLSQNKQMQKLTLHSLLIDKVTVNSAEMTDISYLFIPGVAESILRCLHGATKLQTLECIGLHDSADIDTLQTVLPTLVHLRKVMLLKIDLSDRNIILSPQMMNLEYVRLVGVTWTDARLCEFVASIPDTPHPVTCVLWLYDVEYTRVRDYIHSSPRFVVTDYYPGDGYTSIDFHTQKSGAGTRPQK